MEGVIKKLMFPDPIPLEYAHIYAAIGRKKCDIQLIKTNKSGFSIIRHSGREFKVPSDWLAWSITTASNDFEILQNNIGEWADIVFSDRTAENALTKMVMEEIPEFIAGDLKDSSELADIGVLLLDVAYLQKVNLFTAIKEKMEVNKKRKWKKNSNTGLISHVKGT